MSSTARDRTQLNYELSSKSGPAVVFLHPVGLDLRSWDSVVSSLPENYTTLAVDFPGHGGSEAPAGPFALEDLARRVAHLIRTTLDDHPLVVVGASMGGMVAQIIAIERLCDLCGLVLIDTAATFTETVRDTMRVRAQRALSSGMAALIDETIERWFSREFRDERPDVVDATRERLASDDVQTHAWAWLAIAELDLFDRLPSVGVRSLVLTGSEDVSTPPLLGREIARKLPAGRFAELAGAGHMSYIELPDRVAAELTAFTAEVWTAGIA